MKLSTWKALDESEIKQIHEASLEILEKTGISIESAEVRKILSAKGVPSDGEVVRFPRSVVEDCIAKNLRTFPMVDRNGKEVFILGDGNVRFAGGHNAVFVMTDRAGGRRNSLLKDVADFAHICEKLEDIDMIGVPLNPSDAPSKTMLAHAVAAIMKKSVKPIFFSCESREVNLAIIELAEAASGKRSFKKGSYIISQLSTTSPLFWEKGASESLVDCVSHGIPVAFLPQPISGLTAPYTIAGNITVHNAEVLSGVVISHLINPGTPLIYAAAWTSYDMRHSNVIIGRPEESLMRIAGAQMAHFYNMPSHTIGPDADSNAYDEQLGWEKMMSVLAAVSGGNDLIVNSGMFGTGMTVTNEQLILDNEMNRFAKRMKQGIIVSPETVAAKVIMEVGHRGSFIDQEHTVEYLRSGEHIEPMVIAGMNYGNWQKEGSPDCAALASAKVAALLAENDALPPDKMILENIGRILKKWDGIYS
ncbi:MAG: trimethylamine methyltransferase family protein [Lentisphaerae bacterium]|nr:trimethylamine methyltransferase family protein [Lentisphaerota bacterium]